MYDGYAGIPTDGCGFGELTAPKLMDAYIGEGQLGVDLLTGAWSAGDYLKLTFDTPTNTPNAHSPFTLFELRATGFGRDVNAAELWTLGDHYTFNWTDSSTYVITTMPLGGVVNETLGHWMPDVSQCGYIPPGGTDADKVNCETAMGDGLQSSRGKGIELRVIVKESGGIRKLSDNPLAHAASGVHDYTLTHCNAGPMVAAASI